MAFACGKDRSTRRSPPRLGVSPCTGGGGGAPRPPVHGGSRSGSGSVPFFPPADTTGFVRRR